MRRELAFIAAFLAAACQAHFTLDFPQSRGFNEDIQSQFCGGYPNAGQRLPFPLSSGGLISLTSTHDDASFVTLISFDSDPKNFTAFNTTSSGQKVPYLKSWLKLSRAGEFCFPVDIQSLGITGVGEGTNATIQIVYDGGDGNLHQCADITLSSTGTSTPLRCTNTTSLVSAQAGTSSSAAAPTSSPSASASDAMSNHRVVAASAGASILSVMTLALFFL